MVASSPRGAGDACRENGGLWDAWRRRGCRGKEGGHLGNHARGGKEEQDLETLGKPETRVEMEETYPFCSFYLRGRVVKKQPPLIADTSGLVPISPASQMTQMRPKPRHFSEPWAAREGKKEALVQAGAGRGLRVPLGEARAPASATCSLWFEMLGLNC